jgi:hypothetical protein
VGAGLGEGLVRGKGLGEAKRLRAVPSVGAPGADGEDDRFDAPEQAQNVTAAVPTAANVREGNRMNLLRFGTKNLE